MENKNSDFDVDGEYSFGVICGEDVDAVFERDDAAIREWALGVLQTALERVLVHGENSHELLFFAIDVVWQYSGGEASESSALKVYKWLESQHPRGRRWSEFASLVASFIEQSNEMYAAQLERQERSARAQDVPPF